MCRQILFSIVFLIASTASAQEWRSFFDAAAFGTYVSETGPKKPQSRLFSTNWMIVGTERQVGRGTILGRARFTLEPLTIPKEGYPQLFQYISPESGGPLTDHMRAHDLIEEVAFGYDWKPFQLYLAPVGEPPLGAEPFAQRASSLDFAEAPFAYDVQESFHRATRVVAAAATSRFADLEYGVFHESVSTGKHTNIADGGIDSWSARLTLAPESRLSAQVSMGRLGNVKRKVSSGSISYRGPVWAASGIWTKLDGRAAYALETAMRYWRSTLMARAEVVDRPAGLFGAPDQKSTTHFTVGYIFDVMQRQKHRAGVGINIDYHSNTKAVERSYGHKPQSIYAFVRWRTEGITRPTSP